ncbi:hypothetical protein V5799_006643 [Amblyomma americanum]|uniref:Uncharacterized protein n=1 Tax=Amblyomma americanum TaxID=6943 RepID=A0AAQ4DVT7_AMBAM
MDPIFRQKEKAKIYMGQIQMMTALLFGSSNSPNFMSCIWQCRTPGQKADLFDRPFAQALDTAQQRLIIVGRVSVHPTQRFEREKFKGRRLAMTNARQGPTILADPARPTWIGNSVSRDTCSGTTLSKALATKNGTTSKEPSAVTVIFLKPPFRSLR